MVWEIIGVALFIQLLLANAVYKDAYQRGADQGFYTVLVLITGIIGVLFYLIGRPTEKRPPEERNQSETTNTPNVVLWYSGALVVGFVFSIIVVSIYMELSGFTQTSAIELPDVIFFSGIFVPPLILYMYRSKI